jgi:hypothetical protein
VILSALLSARCRIEPYLDQAQPTLWPFSSPSPTTGAKVRQAGQATGQQAGGKRRRTDADAWRRSGPAAPAAPIGKKTDRPAVLFTQQPSHSPGSTPSCRSCRTCRPDIAWPRSDPGMACEVYVSAPPPSSATVTAGQRAQVIVPGRRTREVALDTGASANTPARSQGSAAACPDRTQAIPSRVAESDAGTFGCERGPTPRSAAWGAAAVGGGALRGRCRTGRSVTPRTAARRLQQAAGLGTSGVPARDVRHCGRPWPRTQPGRD